VTLLAAASKLAIQRLGGDLQYLIGIWQGIRYFDAVKRSANVMNQERRVKLFRNGRNQAVRIPREYEFDGDEAILKRDGDRLILEPVRSGVLLQTGRALGPLTEDMPDIDDFTVEFDEPEVGSWHYNTCWIRIFCLT
jgi:antitoxin VapB